MPKKCKDHLGNEFKSIQEMCEYWGISNKSFCFRNKKGWELEKILTTPPGVGQKKKCKDHLGNEFKSLTDMCKYWGINTEILRTRLKTNTLGDALTRAIEDRNNGKECRDHLGNKFESKAEMCRHWNIEVSVFSKRIKSGWTLEKALTEDTLEPYKKCRDHLGNNFESFRDMCKYWNIDYTVVHSRLRLNWDIKNALTTKMAKYKDHTGKEFANKRDMCKYWGVGMSTFNSRIKSGWTLEKALVGDTPVKDHLGNTFKSVKEMCKYWGVYYATFYARIGKGWDIEKALTTKSYHNRYKDQKEEKGDNK